MKRKADCARCWKCYERIRMIRDVSTEQWMPFDVDEMGDLVLVDRNPVAHVCEVRT